jgi:tetratricopeptide (TPR) repeat protein
MSPQELFDAALYHDGRRQFDISLVCYDLIINPLETPDDDALWQKLRIDALNNSAVIYFWMTDYVKSYQLLIDALDLCEEFPYRGIEFRLQANIGNIHYRLGDWATAERHYSRALGLCTDSLSILRLHNNIGAAKMELGDLDGALRHIDTALSISGRHGDDNLHSVLNTAATFYQKQGLFDEALNRFRSALDHAEKNNEIWFKADNLSGMGRLLVEMGRPREAEPYIASSNVVARENRFADILLDNLLLLSDMERSRGDHGRSLEYLQRYNSMRDSLFGADKLANISQLRRIDEASRTNRQIERLTVEQKVKERTITYQKVILFIVLAVLSLVAAVLLVVLRQKRKLDGAYRALVEKNVRIMELQDGSPVRQPKSAPHHDDDGELLGRILAVMEDTDAICNPKFSINVLSSMVGSNHIYVSQVINTEMNKNFRSFLNDYRIREAQRLFSRSDAARFTLESVSLQLGYKSMNTFRAAFQEITGVSPSFYMKSILDAADD